MAEYNVLHPDNPQYTLLDESAAFMKMILNLSQVQECGFLIFFNKSDIFEERVSDPMLKPDFRKFLGRFIKEGDLKKYEQGNIVKVEVLRKAIASKFADTVNSVVVKRRAPVYHRYTCAVDSKMMETLFATIRTEIINRKIENQDWMFG
ncbi:hypothetical protein Tcan_03568 [Toxocara canis]|uniref:Uncharacterized protein n=1 Tax=Toxocara canis TaxID=6265 RepID=A0A0B2V403_TOXCA|nr:hypothetical protein Tcan_03568 [Toxocara canis]